MTDTYRVLKKRTKSYIQVVATGEVFHRTGKHPAVRVEALCGELNAAAAAMRSLGYTGSAKSLRIDGGKITHP